MRPSFAIESPFATVPQQESGEPDDEASVPAWTPVDSPFTARYEAETPGGLADSTLEAYAELLGEITDREFDEAVYELVQEARELADDGDAEPFGPVRERLTQHFAPLERAATAMFETVADGVDQQDLAALGDTELEMFLETLRPAGGRLSPSFEGFLGKLFNKVKNVAKKGIDLAKKGVKAIATLGLGPLLRKLVGLIKPLIRAVVQRGVNQLPEAVRPYAEKLAGKFLSEIAAEIGYEAPDGEPDGDPGVAGVQRELDLQIADLLLTGESAPHGNGAQAGADDDALGELERARARFVDELGQLKEGDDPTPVVEQFVPAILPALKLGMKLAGRDRIVRILARLVGRLIKRFVGPQHTPMLSRALVDAGLRMIHLEARPDGADLAAREAVAATVEETVRRAAGLPEYVLADEALLEGFALEAFESAAAAMLPPVLPERVYQQRPDLREARGPGGAWVYPPANGCRRRCYQKHTRVFDNVLVDPYVAGTVTTFGGLPLSVFLRDRLGVAVGTTVPARVHLYRAVPGTWLSQISRHERNVPGLGTGARQAWSQLHPLTPLAAGLLLGQPGLGREVPPEQLADPLRVTPGQRFYYLEVAGARPRSLPGSGPRRSSEVNLELNVRQGRARAFVYLSEADAQDMAVKLRQGMPAGAVMPTVNAVVDAALRNALTGGMTRYVRIVHPVALLWPESGQALRRLPAAFLDGLRTRLSEWLGAGFGEYFGQQGRAFIAATEEPADGVTLTVTLENVPGMAEVDRLLLGRTGAGAGALSAGQSPAVSVRAVAGFGGG